MRLNELSPGEGARSTSKRVGRGIGSGLGKTGGRGHKGQKSRSGGYHKVGFEGGQMPVQRRLPKMGFKSRKALTRAQLRTGELNALSGDVTLETLKDQNLVRSDTTSVKVILQGDVSASVNLKGIAVSAGARKAIEAAGGSVE